MKAGLYLSTALGIGILIAALLANPASAGNGSDAPSSSRTPEIGYLEAVNALGPPHDPQLLFLLMAQYDSTNLQGQGVEFFSARLKEFGPRLTDVQKSLYLSAIGLLRAQRAPGVSLFQRIGYVNDTIRMLDEAKQLSGGQVFVVNWIAGISSASASTWTPCAASSRMSRSIAAPS
jgi:hypothetical protein